MNKNIIIYVKQGCPYCIRAKKLLDDKGIQYEEIDVIKDPKLFNIIKSKYNVEKVPQIFVTDEDGNYIHHIRGSDKLIDLENSGELDNILNSMLSKSSNTNLTSDPSHHMEYEEYSSLNDNIDDLI
ncbi:glutaredoxin domain-containing protein [Wolbachia endosymbiont of Chironomus riparius]|uniref:glutaredoxin domain-containing protein n=1 Tax=Wolbachia endosymbiont of Chironomus riparius TaxID=2883238 RepID=UPI00209E4CBB|nr:glutaredoxin domain-containing protein [Wolbachia endosymbiont of Chironomus riparius]